MAQKGEGANLSICPLLLNLSEVALGLTANYVAEVLARFVNLGSAPIPAGLDIEEIGVESGAMAAANSPNGAYKFVNHAQPP